MPVILLHALTDALPWLVPAVGLAGLAYAAAVLRRRPPTRTGNDRDAAAARQARPAA